MAAYQFTTIIIKIKVTIQRACARC
jgi:hypothetical protein